MPHLRDRIAIIESALQNLDEIDPGTRHGVDDHPVRHSLDHRFDKTAADVDAAPAPTPAQEKSNPFDTLAGNTSEVKPQFYDSVAASFGLGIRDEEEFSEFNVYDAFVTNLRVCPVDLNGHSYYVEHRSFLPHIPGVILRRGTEKDGEALGVAHLPLAGRNKIGLGDFKNNPSAVIWESMGNAGFWTHMKYVFEFEPVNGERRKFCWIRTRNNIMDDQGDLVLVEEGRESLILVEYLGKGLLKWKKRGRLRIRQAKILGEKWEMMVLLTWGSVVEVRDASAVRIPVIIGSNEGANEWTGVVIKKKIARQTLFSNPSHWNLIDLYIDFANRNSTEPNFIRSDRYEDW